MGQASQIIEAYQGGRPPDINDLLEGRERMGGDAGMVRRTRRRVRREAPTVIGAAEMEGKRIGVGRKVAPWVVAFEDNALNAAKVMSNFGDNLKALAGIVEKALLAVDKFTKGGGESTLDKLANMLNPFGGSPTVAKGK
jgi:hypothetical protein